MQFQRKYPKTPLFVFSKRGPLYFFRKIKRDFQNLLKIFTGRTLTNFPKSLQFPQTYPKTPSLYFQRGSLTYCIVTFQCGFFYVNFSLVMKNSEQLFSELLFSEHFISDQSRWSSRPLVLFSLGGRIKKLFVEECF